MPALGRYSRLVKPPNSFEPMNEATWVQYMSDVYTQIVTPLAHVQRSSIFGVATAVTTVILFNQKIVDTHDWFVTSTSRYTPLIPGYYHAKASTAWSTSGIAGAGINFNMSIRKNGSAVFTTYDEQAFDYADLRPLQASGFIWMNGRTDYFDVTLTQSTGVSASMVTSRPDLNYFQVVRLSS